MSNVVLTMWVLTKGEVKRVRLSSDQVVFVHLAYSRAEDPENPIIDGLPYFINLKIYSVWR